MVPGLLQGFPEPGMKVKWEHLCGLVPWLGGTGLKLEARRVCLSLELDNLGQMLQSPQRLSSVPASAMRKLSIAVCDDPCYIKIKMGHRPCEAHGTTTHQGQIKERFRKLRNRIPRVGPYSSQQTLRQGWGNPDSLLMDWAFDRHCKVSQ